MNEIYVHTHLTRTFQRSGVMCVASLAHVAHARVRIRTDAHACPPARAHTCHARARTCTCAHVHAHAQTQICTPSRAGFLTGRLPARAGLPNVVFPTGSTKSMIFDRLLSPKTNKRLPAEEITLANILKASGYSTGMIGKWHMGDRSPSLPNDMGFERYYGALYSNDMEPFAFYRNTEIEVEAPVEVAALWQLERTRRRRRGAPGHSRVSVCEVARRRWSSRRSPKHWRAALVARR